MNAILRTAWERWQIIARANGDYIGRFMVNLFYFTILVPFAFITKLFMDPLELRLKVASHWKARKAVGATLDEARSQF